MWFFSKDVLEDSAINFGENIQIKVPSLVKKLDAIYYYELPMQTKIGVFHYKKDETRKYGLSDKYNITDIEFLLTIALSSLLVNKLILIIENERRSRKLIKCIDKSLRKLPDINGHNHYTEFMGCNMFTINPRFAEFWDKDNYLIANWVVWNLIDKEPDSEEEKKLVTNISSVLLEFSKGYWEYSMPTVSKQSNIVSKRPKLLQRLKLGFIKWLIQMGYLFFIPVLLGILSTLYELIF